jgi:hypothetical protein
MKTLIAAAVVGVSAVFFGMGETAQAGHQTFPGGHYGHSHGSSYRGGYGYNSGYGSGYGYRIQPVWPRQSYSHGHYGHHHHYDHGHHDHGHHNHNRYGSRIQLRFGW